MQNEASVRAGDAEKIHAVYYPQDRRHSNTNTGLQVVAVNGNFYSTFGLLNLSKQKYCLLSKRFVGIEQWTSELSSALLCQLCHTNFT